MEGDVSYFTLATFSGRAAASRLARDQWFESVSLQQRVNKLSVPRAMRLRWRNQIHCTRVRKVRIQFPPAVSQQTFGSSQDNAVVRLGATAFTRIPTFAYSIAGVRATERWQPKSEK